MTSLPNPRPGSRGEGAYRSPLARPTLVDVNLTKPIASNRELAPQAAHKPTNGSGAGAGLPVHKKSFEDDDAAFPRRSPWRQRWVDTERGWTHSFRSESTFFVHFFIASLVACSAFVVGVTAFEWAVLILCFSLVMSAEMIQCALRRIASVIPTSLEAKTEQTLQNPDILPLPHLSTSSSHAESRIPNTETLSTELLRIGTAAVMTATIGSCLATACIFWSHLWNWLQKEGVLDVTNVDF